MGETKTSLSTQFKMKESFDLLKMCDDDNIWKERVLLEEGEDFILDENKFPTWESYYLSRVIPLKVYLIDKRASRQNFEHEIIGTSYIYIHQNETIMKVFDNIVNTLRNEEILDDIMGIIFSLKAYGTEIFSRSVVTNWSISESENNSLNKSINDEKILKSGINVYVTPFSSYQKDIVKSMKNNNNNLSMCINKYINKIDIELFKETIHDYSREFFADLANVLTVLINNNRKDLFSASLEEIKNSRRVGLNYDNIIIKAVYNSPNISDDFFDFIEKESERHELIISENTLQIISKRKNPVIPI